MSCSSTRSSTLGVPAGGTTDDGVFTLERMECLAACGGAPCLQVNYRYVENVTTAAFDSLVADLRANRRAEEFPPHGTLSRVPPVPAARHPILPSTSQAHAARMRR